MAMIVYMSLEEQVDAYFTRARRRAFFWRLIAVQHDGDRTMQHNRNV